MQIARHRVFDELKWKETGLVLEVLKQVLAYTDSMSIDIGVTHIIKWTTPANVRYETREPCCGENNSLLQLWGCLDTSRI